MPDDKELTNLTDRVLGSNHRQRSAQFYLDREILAL